MSPKLRIQTLVCCLFFGISTMAVMLVYSANKMIVIADVAQDAADAQKDGQEEEPADSAGTDVKRLLLLEEEDRTNYLCIPLPAGLKAEKIQIENRYMEKQLWVFLQDIPGNFYETRAVSGNFSQVASGALEYKSQGICLKFELTDVYEYKSILENDFLYIEFVAPREIYDKIVVIDAGHGGEDRGWENGELTEKEIALDIVKKLKEKLDGTQIKVYYTRMGDENPTEAERIYLANTVKADMFISIHVNFDKDSDLYGTETFYNASFFIPGFGSVELADTLEREVVTGISGKGNGIFEAEAECFSLQNASVPAALLKAGYLSNKQEALLLGREDYRQRIADGIYQAILKAYE